MNKITYPEKIKIARSRLGLDQKEFGMLFRVSPTAVSLWESGQREASYNVLEHVESIISESTIQACGACKGKGYITVIDEK